MVAKRTLLVALVAFTLLPALPLRVAAAPALGAAPKTIKKLIGGIRYGKTDLAAKQLGFVAMSEALLGEAWSTLSTDEQGEFAKGLETLIRRISFTRGREIFAHIDTVLYGDPKVKDGKARCKTTIIIHRNYKKSELIIEWVLTERSGKWVVLDTVMLGDSTLEGLREEQIQPLLKEGGKKALLDALRKKLDETRKS